MLLLTPILNLTRAILAPALLLGGLVNVALGATPVAGQGLADYLDACRREGMPLAWSSQLVPDGLEVRSVPATTDPRAMLQAVLAEHGLGLRSTEGLLLVVRITPLEEPNTETSLLVVVRNQDGQRINGAKVAASPPLPEADDLGGGVFQFPGVPPGHYSLLVSAAGYSPAVRTLRTPSQGVASLHLRLDPLPAELERLNVSASRYVLLSSSQFFIDQRAIQALPDIGDDPVRAAHRLPGTAAGGWSARSHFRGGEENETAIYLNGLRLLDPFHVRDFHNIFSTIDARTISGVEAWTGGFPARYGDRMSGMLLLESQRPERPRRYELGLSVFNTSVLASGHNAAGTADWLLSARRSNLDLVLDRQDHGEPSYHDLFAELGLNFSPRTHVSVNALSATDEVLVITENSEEDQEYSTSDTRNRYLWTQVATQWNERLESRTVLSVIDFSNERNAVANDPEQLVGQVYDDREVEIFGVSQHWDWEAAPRHLLRIGLEARHERARYRYLSDAEYGGAYLLYPGVEESLQRDISARPSGDAWSVYLADRMQLGEHATLEAGLRWDRQDWQGTASGDQLSPRFNLLYAISDALDLRLAWGDYYQSQGIHELQVTDGEDDFYPAQRATHRVAGIEYRPRQGITLRIEAFGKDYRDLRPRWENLLDPLPLIPELEPDRIRIAPTSARSRGLEVTLDYDLGGDWTGWTSWTLSRVTDRVQGREEPRNWDQRHSLQAGLAWTRGPWEAGAAVRLHSGWPTTSAELVIDEDGEYQILFGPRNRENLDTFFNLDVRLSYAWEWPGNRVTAFVEVSNLSDRRNECCVDYDVEYEDEEEEAPLLERSVDHWLGITPAIGVLWEF